MVIVLGGGWLDSGAGHAVNADCGFILSRNPDVVRAPDAAFIARGRLPAGKRPQGFFEGAPDLAVEVVSPGDPASEVRAKITDYLNAGTRAVWVVHPISRKIEVHKPDTEALILDEDAILDGDPVLPNLRIAVRDIFAE